MFPIIDAFVPFAVFLSIVVVIALILRHQYRIKKLKMEAIFIALKRADSIDVEIIEAIKRDDSTLSKDLRRGIVFMAFAVAVATFSRFLSLLRSPELSDAVFGLAVFPAAIGAVYLMFYFLSKK
ncbi:hypothetical protein NBRC116583_03500 [Arenicella sp. 4NH20-0111]|uniref:DUF6249 domain-containing protein n=1 Tax=Arenicella sp. 4NH20-0111 TaxID=3127648 RepID=UPI003107AC4A